MFIAQRQSEIYEKPELIVYIRLMIKKDLPEVLAIEQMCFEFPWPKKDFEISRNLRNCFGFVAEYKNDIVGFMIYQLQDNQIFLRNIAVAPDCSHYRIGDQMIARLVSKLSPRRLHSVTAEVRETNLVAQKFFRHNEFKVVDILHNYYEETDDDTYVFRYVPIPSIITPDKMAKNYLPR